MSLNSILGVVPSECEGKPYKEGDSIGTNLEIYLRMFNLLKRIYPALKNYPKSEKYALAQDTKNCFYEYLNYISRANNVKSKRLVYSQEAEAYLQKIKLNIMLAYYLKYIGKGFYRDICLELTEVSKMLAGYIKSINRK